MKLLLDTHVFLWATVDDERLSAKVRTLLLAGEGQLLVSVASLWEIAIKAAAGRAVVWSNPQEIPELESWVVRLGAGVLPITARHALGTWELREWAHKDPFDRLLAAQAIAEGATLITADPLLQGCPGLKWLWN